MEYFPHQIEARSQIIGPMMARGEGHEQPAAT
jgi:hypothetical protein